MEHKRPARLALRARRVAVVALVVERLLVVVGAGRDAGRARGAGSGSRGGGGGGVQAVAAVDAARERGGGGERHAGGHVRWHRVEQVACGRVERASYSER